MSKSAVVYYSWAGHTKKMAEGISKQTGADLIEILLQNPYSQNYDLVLKQAKNEIQEKLLCLFALMEAVAKAILTGILKNYVPEPQ